MDFQLSQIAYFLIVVLENIGMEKEIFFTHISRNNLPKTGQKSVTNFLTIQAKNALLIAHWV